MIQKAALEKKTAAAHEITLALGTGQPQPQPVQTKVLRVDERRLLDNRIVAFCPEIPAADAYKLVRTRILEATKDRGLNTVLVTGPHDSRSIMMTALNLAITFALDVDQTVLLVETDFRSPALMGLLGLAEGMGLAEYLLDDVPLNELLVNPGIAKLTLLPAGRKVPASTEVLDSPKMERLVAELKARYPDRYVILSGAPLLAMSDSLVLSAQADGTVLVVEERRTLQSDVKRAVDLLRGKNLLGTVLHRAPGSPA